MDQVQIKEIVDERNRMTESNMKYAAAELIMSITKLQGDKAQIDKKIAGFREQLRSLSAEVVTVAEIMGDE